MHVNRGCSYILFMLLRLIFKFVMIVPFDCNLCCLEEEMEGGLETILRDINSMKKGGSCVVRKSRESKNRKAAAGAGAPCRNLFIFSNPPSFSCFCCRAHGFTGGACLWSVIISKYWCSRNITQPVLLQTLCTKNDTSKNCTPCILKLCCHKSADKV